MKSYNIQKQLILKNRKPGEKVFANESFKVVANTAACIDI